MCDAKKERSVMSDDDIITERVLTQSSETATIHAPIGTIDIADWLLHLPDKEYQRCAPPDHMAAGFTTTDDGRPMSINVEEIGGSLLVQHYVAEIHQPRHCHMVSLSDVLTPGGWTKLQVIWDLSVAELDENTCQYTNTVISYPTRGFLDALASAGVSFDAAAAERDAPVSAHNRLETSHYATSIERKALVSRRP
jgi:hypothetical protein